MYTHIYTLICVNSHKKLPGGSDHCRTLSKGGGRVCVCMGARNELIDNLG